MQQIIDFFVKLFDTSDFPARWQAGNWTAFHGWLYVISDLLLAFAFIAIPIIALKYILQKNCPGRLKNLYIVFASFLIGGGLILLTDAVTFWHPVYRLSGALRLMTASLSWIAVFSLVKILPNAFTMRSQQELEDEVRLRSLAEDELQFKTKQLMEAEKIARLCYVEWDIAKDSVILSDEGYHMYGLTQKQVFSFNSFIALIHPDDRQYVGDKANDIIRVKRFSEFGYRIISNNTEKHIRVKGELHYDHNGSVTRLIGTLQDVTEHVLYLDHIKEQNEKLKDIAWIQSHLVRGPLATILGLASIIEGKGDLDDDTMRAIEGIKVASNDLDEIVKDIVSKSYSRELIAKRTGQLTRVA